ncbi:hypothetical protein [Streptomonospora litoralis]|uniref:Uncharacterized protein n=1 Tax=Streptomonospora litoralis TaxID=2498135 RepID=A0A4P6Q2I3_9ACTN|nr:hypothetical protein [Streptomonospora litoralis]QBI53079.1 hypothetical protein EKD16_06405 [Streptomonospora litoralis]
MNLGNFDLDPKRLLSEVPKRRRVTRSSSFRIRAKAPKPSQPPEGCWTQPGNISGWAEPKRR